MPTGFLRLFVLALVSVPRVNANTFVATSSDARKLLRAEVASNVAPSSLTQENTVVTFDALQGASEIGVSSIAGFKINDRIRIGDQANKVRKTFADNARYTAALAIMLDTPLTKFVPKGTIVLKESPPPALPTQSPTPTCHTTPDPTKDPTLATRDPTKEPTKSPTKVPTGPPTDDPTPSPTPQPTHVPPTKDPTKEPTRFPTHVPTRYPTTKEPTPEPTRFPTKEPTSSPHPTKDPTREPTTAMPTGFPTTVPTTKDPTMSPSGHPTKDPTKHPTTDPTPSPTPCPTNTPTKLPTRSPTKSPTRHIVKMAAVMTGWGCGGSGNGHVGLCPSFNGSSLQIAQVACMDCNDCSGVYHAAIATDRWWYCSKSHKNEFGRGKWVGQQASYKCDNLDHTSYCVKKDSNEGACVPSNNC